MRCGRAGSGVGAFWGGRAAGWRVPPAPAGLRGSTGRPVPTPAGRPPRDPPPARGCCGRAAQPPRQCPSPRESPRRRGRPWPARRRDGAGRARPGGRPSRAEGRRDDLGRQPHHEHTDRAPQCRAQLTGRRHRERQRQRHRQDRAIGPGGRGQARHQGQDDRQRCRSSAAARAEHEPEHAADGEQHGQHQALTGHPVDAGRPQEPAEPAHGRDHEEAQAGRADQGRDGRSRCRRAEEHQVAVAGPQRQEGPVVEPGEPGRPPQRQGKERGTDLQARGAGPRQPRGCTTGAGAVVGWTWSAVRARPGSSGAAGSCAQASASGVGVPTVPTASPWRACGAAGRARRCRSSRPATRRARPPGFPLKASRRRCWL